MRVALINAHPESGGKGNRFTADGADRDSMDGRVGHVGRVGAFRPFMHRGPSFLAVLVRALVIVIELDLLELKYGLLKRTRRP